MALRDAWNKFFKKDAPFREAMGATVDPDDDDWVRLTGDEKRNLSGVSQQRMQELAVYLWKTNTIAKALVEVPIAYLLADGVSAEADDEEAQQWINDFWEDPINEMDIKLEKKVRELSIYGEQCWPAFVNEMNGDVRLGYLDPGLIATIVTDPDNIEQPIGVVTKKDKKGIARRFKVIINGPEEVFSNRTREIREGFTDGECFYFTVNALSNADRGHSDYLPQMDWLDAYDQAMFGELERWDFLRAHIWDVTIKGADEEGIKKRAKEIHAPNAGSVRVHNEAEEWNAVTPDLHASDSSTNARLFRNHILGGNTFPEHWFGGGGDVNRSTAEGMGEPTVKTFQMRQNYIRYILVFLLKFVIRQKLSIYGDNYTTVFMSDPAYKPKITFPELTSKDTSKFATAFQQVVIAGVAAMDQGVLSEESVISLVAMIAGQLGLEIDVKAEMEKILAEKEKREEADNFVGAEDDLDDDE